MLQPVLLVGVGGSGAKALRTLRQTLLRRLRQHGWTSPDLPAAWQIVALDTVTDQAKDGYGAPLLPATSYVGLVDPSTEYVEARDILLSRVSGMAQIEAYGGWLPKSIPNEIVYGAGQNRGVGRAVSAWKLSQIRDELNRAYKLAVAPKSIAELKETAQLLGAGGASSSDAFAVVISSIAGGTGSGMFLDVVEALKSVNQSLGVRAQVVLFGPDVFAPVVESGKGPNIAANTMAAMSEITAGAWGGRFSPGTRALYEASGFGSVVLQRGEDGPLIGSRYNYVIGAVNTKGVKVGETDAAYRAAGDSIAALVADEDVLDGFNNFFRTNIFDNSYQSKVSGDSSGLRTPDDSRFTSPFGSFGSARLTLGLDRFIEYASQAVARSGVERLLWPRFDIDPKDDRTDQEKIQDRVAIRWVEFLDRTGLDERADHDQVINALRPDDHETALSEFVNSTLQAAAAGVGADGLAPADWLVRIRRDLPLRLERFTRGRRVAIEAQASRFARTIEARLLGTVARFAASDGLAVAAALVDKLEQEVRFVVREDLPTEASKMESRIDELDGRLARNLDNGLKMVPVQHPSIDEVRATLRAAASSLAEASVRRRVAAELLLLVAAEVLTPLAAALDEGRAALSLDADQERTPHGDANPFLDFPRLGERPGPEFAPGPTEFLLLPVDGYVEALEDALRRTYPAELRDQWNQRTIERALLDLPLGDVQDDEVPGLVHITSGWMPTAAAFRWNSSASPQAGRYQVRATTSEHREVAEARLSDPDTAVGRYLGQTLTEYLAIPDVAEQARRWSAFTNGLIAAFDASAPLVQFNTKLANVLHPNAKWQPIRVMSKIPVDEGSELYDRVRTALSQAQLWDESSPGWFGRSQASQIDIFQALNNAVSAMAFTSLMGPVNEDWQEIRFKKEAATSYRQYKRARPFIETVPVSHDRIAMMIKGWVVAGLLGLRRDVLMTSSRTRVPLRHRSDRDPAYRLVETWNFGDQQWVEFPFPLLDRNAGGIQLLPAVLESVQLAMAEATVAGSLAPLACYQSLIDLGADVESVDNPLGAWVLEGQQPIEGVDTVPVESGTAAMDVAGRREEVLAYIAEVIAGYDEHFRAVERARDPFAIDPVWEIREWVTAAYEGVRDVVVAMVPTTGVRY